VKIECELCHVTAEVGEMVPRPGGMDVRCAVCTMWFFVPASGGAAAAPPPAEPAGKASGPYRTVASGAGCPKCGRARADGPACPRCGLVYENWKDGMETAGALDERAEELWQDVERGWLDQTRHDAFVQYCSRAGLLAGAGRRYRERLDRERDESVATRMQQRIVNMATQMLGPHGTPTQPITRTRWFAAVVVVVAVVGALGGLLIGGR